MAGAQQVGIEIITGSIGGGKTYHAMEMIAQRLCQGGVVATNCVLNKQAFADYVLKKTKCKMDPRQIVELTYEQVLHFPEHSPAMCNDIKTLIIIDEAHIWLNARSWNDKLNAPAKKNLMEYAAQTRKQGTDLVFIVQNESMLDSQVKALATAFWYNMDMQNLKIPGLRIKYPLAQFLRQKYHPLHKTKSMERQWVAKDKKIFDLYNTDQMLVDIKRTEMDVKKNFMGLAGKRNTPKNLDRMSWIRNGRSRKRMRSVC